MIEAESEKLGMGLHDRSEIVLAVARINVLVDGDVGKETEADFVAGRHHDGVVVGIGRATHHVGTLDGGSGRAAANDTAAVEEVKELLESAGVEISIG